MNGEHYNQDLKKKKNQVTQNLSTILSYGYIGNLILIFFMPSNRSDECQEILILVRDNK